MAQTLSLKGQSGTGEKPQYRVLQGGFYTAKGQMLNAGDILRFNGEPNLNFEPMNAAAQAKMDEFLSGRNAMAQAATDKIAKDKGVYLAPEKYRQRSYDQEESANPKHANDKGKLMGMNPDPDDTEVILVGPPPGTLDRALPGSVSAHVVHGD